MATITFNFDRKPEPLVLGGERDETRADGTMAHLLGWAFSPDPHPVTARLILDGTVIAEQLCQTPRHDVHAAFPGFSQSLLSGFEWLLPYEALDRLAAGRLWVTLAAEEVTTRAWTWSGGHEADDPITAVKQLRRHLGEQDVQTTRLIRAGQRRHCDPACYSLEIVLDASGLKHRLDPHLAAVAELVRRQPVARISRLTVLAREDAEVPSLAEHLERAELPTRVAVRYLSRGVQLDSIGSEDSAVDERHSIVLFIGEDADTRCVDLSALIKDFVEIPQVTVLMPAVYGDESLLPPSGVHLPALRAATRVQGVDMPALYAATTPSPLWVTTASLLRELFSARAVTDSTLAVDDWYLPKAGAPLYYLDLRQPMLSPSVRYPRHEREQMQYVIDEQVQKLAPQEPSTRPVLLVVDGVDLAEAGTRQIEQLADALQRQGYRVVLTSEGVEQQSLLGHWSV
ncbi:MAG: hypothetical protein KDD69_15165, partial [Bdellovibrionales bacterium]|nr:hypothetical protein [Bdellovibrionales bacterium]